MGLSPQLVGSIGFLRLQAGLKSRLYADGDSLMPHSFILFSSVL
jgi:hypothetical protein